VKIEWRLKKEPTYCPGCGRRLTDFASAAGRTRCPDCAAQLVPLRLAGDALGVIMHGRGRPPKFLVDWEKDGALS